VNEHLEELVDELRGSLRRAEHSYYVSLKYTRTVDVIRNLIDRIIETLEQVTIVLLDYNKEKGNISEIPDNLIDRVNIVKELYAEDERFMDAYELFFFLRKARRQTYTKSEEFRRHVAMTAKVDGEEYVFNIDLMGEYYHMLEDWVKHALNIAFEKKEEEY